MILERVTKKEKPKKRELSARTKGGSLRYPKGRPVRFSSYIYTFLDKKRLRARGESWDEFMRRAFGITQKDGTRYPLFELWVLRSTGETFPTKALARGQSVRNGVMKGHAGKFEEPIRLRETV